MKKRILSALLIASILILGLGNLAYADSWVNISALAADYVSSTPEHIVQTSSGTYWASYGVELAGGDELNAVSSADGITWGSPAVIATATDTLEVISMAVETTNYITVIYWTDYGTDGIYAITYNGSSWGSPELVVAITTYIDGSVAVAWGDYIHLFYENDSAGSVNPVLYHTWEDGGSWEAPEAIVSYTGYYVNGIDVVASSDKLYFFWGRVNAGYTVRDIYMRSKVSSTLGTATALYTTGAVLTNLSKPLASVGVNGDDVYLSFFAELASGSNTYIALTKSIDGGATWDDLVYAVESESIAYCAMSINEQGIVSIIYYDDISTITYYASSVDNYQTKFIDMGTVLGTFTRISVLDGYYPRVGFDSLARSDTGIDILMQDVLGGFDDAIYRHVTITTLSSLFVVTKNATDITINSATLNGELVTLSGLSYARVYFEYGLTNAYGTTTAQQVLTATGGFQQNTANSGQWQNINGEVVYLNPGSGLNLLPNTTYHYRAVATSGSTTVYGTDISFTTLSTVGASTDIVVKNVKVFTTYKVAGDYLFVGEFVNNYSGLAPIERPGDYFMIQLVDTDNTTVLAASPLQNWGDRPQSIYINATQGAGLTYGSAYYVKMVGYNVAGTPTASHTLVSTDWKGTDLTKLDAWLIGTAYSMQLIDNRNDYVQNLNNRLVISDRASQYFIAGIPGIATQRPNDFASVTKSITTSAGADAGTWDSANAWETAVGTSIKDDANILGTPFGVTGKNFLAGGIIAAMLGCAILVVSQSGGSGALGAVLIAIPLLWIGTYMKIVPIMVITVICIIFAMFAIRQFVIKTL